MGKEDRTKELDFAVLAILRRIACNIFSWSIIQLVEREAIIKAFVQKMY